ncbi:MAG: hypothetical protein ACK4E0_00485 [Chitinophagaceae bacterium]
MSGGKYNIRDQSAVYFVSFAVVANSRNVAWRFWRQHDQPTECYSRLFNMQKIDYIHQNREVAGLGNRAGDYRLGSTIDFARGQCLRYIGG